MPRTLRPVADRLWEKIDKSGECWLWTGATNPKGYGRIKTGGRGTPDVYVHRLSWELIKGSIPDGLCVLHNCPGGDNPRCVNPAHLFLGTIPQNNTDMAKKGRHWVNATGGKYPRPERLARGERHGTHTHPESFARNNKGQFTPKH